MARTAVSDNSTTHRPTAPTHPGTKEKNAHKLIQFTVSFWGNAGTINLPLCQSLLTYQGTLNKSYWRSAAKMSEPAVFKSGETTGHSDRSTPFRRQSYHGASRRTDEDGDGVVLRTVRIRNLVVPAGTRK